jgi:hypothetical protein
MFHFQDYTAIPPAILADLPNSMQKCTRYWPDFRNADLRQHKGLNTPPFGAHSAQGLFFPIVGVDLLLRCAF